ncbi:UDP-N-acetylmuramoyl-L-alanine--D-glutamate ligase [Sphingomonas flavescens]|uniref:UDP-N-acetylmuramoyl-L-alanine--D-glutamate ligase n=1 Tax=Sphingomonas flavescens TaxID=3132797 RepID=UPI0028065AEE|nr:UDP-N-acetylmuramoyl-L-alanine--D-glutamate ligase [Sphingomonas limnosediminicola]
MITSRAFAGKHYAVYGLARSGIATVEALLASRAHVTAWDAKEEARANAPAGTELANLDEADLSQFDSLVVTPGLPLNRHPIAQRARDAGVEIIGDIELFARARPELPPHKVVGITGTNGKSTTTALVHHILKTAGVPTTMGGNIGLPILSQDPLPKGGVYVLELSSYQIDLTQSLDCDVAVLLNITPDHLDRYESFEAYAASKARLFAVQTARHTPIFVEDRGAVSQIAAEHEEFSENVLIVTAGELRSKDLQSRIGRQEDWPTLAGPHNAENVIAAVWAARNIRSNFIGRSVVSWDKIRDALRTYPGLPHRMERICDLNGVLFVNDSKATNPTATAPALAAFERIRWICGGQAKTDNLDECSPFFGHVVAAYTIGEAADLFERLLGGRICVKNCGKLADAIRAAAADSAPGDTVLLSPACASFDQFRDFEDRGDQFRDLVGKL